MRQLTKEDQEQLKLAAQDAVKAGWPQGKTKETSKDKYQVQMSKGKDDITAEDLERLMEIFRGE